MTMMSGFDIRQIDIYEEDSFGPPPRFLVEPVRRDQRPDDDSDDAQHDLVVPLIAKFKAIFSALRW